MLYPSNLPWGLPDLPRWSRAAHLFFIAVALAGMPGAAQAFKDEDVARAYERLDRDGDGRVDQSEYEVNKVFAFFRPRGGEPSGTNEGPMRVTYQESPLTQQAFDQLDRNGDGVLSGEEVIASEMFRFDRLDRNGDGVLDRAELATFMTSIGR
jgi:EF hand